MAIIKIIKKKTNVSLMIHISQEELLKKIEQEHNQLISENEKEVSSDISSSSCRREMSSILPTTCGKLRDRNNNSVGSVDDEDEIQAVLITGKEGRIIARAIK